MRGQPTIRDLERDPHWRDGPCAGAARLDKLLAEQDLLRVENR